MTEHETARPRTDPVPAGAGPEASHPSSEAEPGFWSNYWERFRRQEVDDPVEERREGLWDRFKRQDVDDPVDRRSR
jgi:hypothetical protein